MTQIGSIFRSPIWTYLFLNGVSFPVSSPVAAAAIAASSNKNGRSVVSVMLSEHPASYGGKARCHFSATG